VHELRVGSLELLEEKREGGGPRKKKQRRAAAMQDSGAMWRKTRRDNFDGWREAQLVALARTARPLGRDLCVRTLKALTRCSGNFYQARFERLQLDQREGSLRPHGSRVGPSDTRGPGRNARSSLAARSSTGGFAAPAVDHGSAPAAPSGSGLAVARARQPTGACSMSCFIRYITGGICWEV
jgi:hypothetical protein